jgi:thiamine transport system permease protein
LKKNRAKSLTTALVLLVVAVLFAPLFYRFFSPASLYDTFISARTFLLFKTTLFQAFLSTLLCFLISLAPSYYVAHNSNLLSKILDSTFFIPFFFPVVSTIISFTLIFKMLPGSLNYSLTAVLIAHVFYNTPLFIKYISEAWKKINISLIEYTQLESESVLGILKNVIAPHILKAALRAFFLVFTFCFTSFGIVLSLGNLKLATFETAIFQEIQTSLDITTALSLALLQFIFLIIINVLITKTDGYELDETSVIKNGGKRFIIFLGSMLFLLFELVVVTVPIISSIYFSVTKGINYFANILGNDFNRTFPVIAGFINSITLSTVTGLIVTLLTYVLIINGSKLTEFLITSLFTISMAMISIALIILHITTGLPAQIMLTIGFIFVTIPVSYSFLQQHVSMFNVAIREQSKTDGASTLQTIIFIELPILLPVLFANFLQVSAIIFGEFTISYMFQSGSTFPLLSVVNYTIHGRRLLGESYALNTFATLLVVTLFIASSFVNSRLSQNRK